MNDEDILVVLAALEAVTPSGGGGSLHSLSERISQSNAIDLCEIDTTLVLDMQRTATKELATSFLDNAGYSDNCVERDLIRDMTAR